MTRLKAVSEYIFLNFDQKLTEMYVQFAKLEDLWHVL